MALKPLPSPEVLRQLLRYEPETGRLFWKERPDGPPQWNGTYAGKPALATPDKDGYLGGAVLKKRVLAHRVIWAMCSGRWPLSEIDHINGSPSDNRIANLREASRSENCMNIGITRRNSSGRKGVCWHKANQKWVASIRVGGRLKYLGSFRDIEAASDAYKRAAISIHGQFYNAGAEKAS